MILDAACEPPSVRGLTPRRAAPPARRSTDAAALVAAQHRRRAAFVLRRRRRARPRRAHRTDGVGHLAGDAGHRPRCAGTGDASRRPRRPADRRQRRGAARPCSPRSRPPVATVRTNSAVDSILCDGERVRGVGLVDGTEIDAPIVVSACNPHDTFLRWLQQPARRGRRSAPALAGGPARRGLRVEARRRARSRAPATSGHRPHRSGRPRSIAPGLADIDRGRRPDASGAGARPSRDARQRRRRCSTRRWLPPAVTCSASRCCSPRSRCAGGWDGFDRTAALARAVRRALRAWLPRLDRRLAGDDAGRVRARLPPPGRSRHELRRWSAGRLPQHRTPSSPSTRPPSTGCTSPARRRSPAPVSGARAAATAPRSSSNSAPDHGGVAPKMPRSSAEHAIGHLRASWGVDADMTPGSLPLGRYAGIPVRAHWSMALIVVLVRHELAGSLGLVRRHRRHRWRSSPRSSPTSSAMRSWPGATASRPNRSTCGCSAASPNSTANRPTPRADGLIAVAGPAVSLLIGVARARCRDRLRIGGPRLDRVSSTSLLAVFNMLPGAPLDGGRVLRAWRWASHRQQVPGGARRRPGGPCARMGDGRHRPGHDAQRHAGHLHRPDRPVHRHERPRRDHGVRTSPSSSTG